MHHTATVNGDVNPAATVRAIYRYHTIDRGFGDIGYQFLVDEAGNVYEGRHTGEATPGYRGTDGVVAAHVGGFNSGNVAVSLLGTLTDRRPTAGAQRGTEAILAELATRSGINPTGSSTYVNPVSGATRTGPNLPGHRDFAATECPGGIAYQLLPTLRRNVVNRQAGTAQDLTAPTITNIATSGTTSIKVAWSTGERSDTQVEYWPKNQTAHLFTPLNLAFVNAHAVTLTGLRRQTTYQYRVISTDEAGNRAISTIRSFVAR